MTSSSLNLVAVRTRGYEQAAEVLSSDPSTWLLPEPRCWYPEQPSFKAVPDVMGSFVDSQIHFFVRQVFDFFGTAIQEVLQLARHCLPIGQRRRLLGGDSADTDLFIRSDGPAEKLLHRGSHGCGQSPAL